MGPESWHFPPFWQGESWSSQNPGALVLALGNVDCGTDVAVVVEAEDGEVIADENVELARVVEVITVDETVEVADVAFVVVAADVVAFVIDIVVVGLLLADDDCEVDDTVVIGVVEGEVAADEDVRLD